MVCVELFKSALIIKNSYMKNKKLTPKQSLIESLLRRTKSIKKARFELKKAFEEADYKLFNKQVLINIQLNSLTKK